MSSYNPKPMDTDKIKIDESLLELTEFLSKNIHEVWSKQRMEEGWVFGKERDDYQKTHPCLIPYENLPDNEKEYDRKTALETIKMILSLGYNIELPPEKIGSKDTNSSSNLIKFIKNQFVNIDQLFHLWHNRQLSRWNKKAEIYITFAEKALAVAEPLLAYDILKEATVYYPENIRLQQLMALTYAKLGMPLEANNLLVNLIETEKNEESIGLLARTYKDLWIKNNKKSDLDNAINFYRVAFREYKSYWAGINFATLLLLDGRREKSLEISSAVKASCLSELDKGQNSYWLYATMGEANLLEKNYQKAIEWFQEGVKLNRQNIGDINSTRRNIKLILEKLSTPPTYIQKIEMTLSVPKIICFTGHRVDNVGVKTKRFPQSLVEDVKDKLKKYLETLGPCIGYCSAANGSDLLFIEVMAKLGNKVYVILPLPKDVFLQECVTTNEQDCEWSERYHDIFSNRKVSIIQLEGLSVDFKEQSFIFANRILYGLAKMKANQLDTQLFPLSIWHPQELEKRLLKGGTTHCLSEWQSLGHHIQYFDLDAIAKRKAYLKSLMPISNKIKFIEHAKNSETRGIFFCDAVNYSKLKDQEFVLFQRILNEIILDTLAMKKFNILAKNSWGDAIHMVFESVQDAGLFALNFNRILSKHPWSRAGLSQPIQIRSAVHAGPVFKANNPITQNDQYVGSHICRTARLEPVTPPGEVYTTMEFAALSYASKERVYDCIYIGRMNVPKEKIEIPLFHLREFIKDDK